MSSLLLNDYDSLDHFSEIFTPSHPTMSLENCIFLPDCLWARSHDLFWQMYIGRHDASKDLKCARAVRINSHASCPGRRKKGDVGPDPGPACTLETASLPQPGPAKPSRYQPTPANT